MFLQRWGSKGPWDSGIAVSQLLLKCKKKGVTTKLPSFGAKYLLQDFDAHSRGFIISHQGLSLGDSTALRWLLLSRVVDGAHPRDACLTRAITRPL